MRRNYCNSINKPQRVPPDLYFRQDKGLEKCPVVDRETEYEGSEYGEGPDELEECVRRFVEPKKMLQENPLHTFDKSMKAFMKRDILSESPPRKSEPLPGFPTPQPPAASLRLLLEEELGDGQQINDDYTNNISVFAQKFMELDRVYRYEEALKAAEEAAYLAPPEYIEEAALAGAKDYVLNLTGSNDVTDDGDAIIQVISYIGITKPK